MPSRSLRQRSSGAFSIGAVVCLALASVAGFAAEAAAGRISKCTTITEPGSYVLTRNPTAAGSCIVVAADLVTIDLGGWVITGPGDTGAGVADEGNPRKGIALRNGVVTGFNDSVRLGGSGAVVEKVRASASETGIAVGADGIVSGNIVRGGDTTILAGFGSIVRNNVVPSSDFGIGAGPGSTVTGNTAHPRQEEDDVGLGLGISVRCPSSVIANTATGATQNLVLAGDGCTDIGNTAF